MGGICRGKEGLGGRELRAVGARAVFNRLSRALGPDRVIWRYDPIVLSDVTDADFHRRNFSHLARSGRQHVRRKERRGEG
ncbi:MAG: DUF1848 family protein [Clostridia bacterium]|nr:MAG: DUF1848 family protein [Clostridia bacterium]